MSDPTLPRPVAPDEARRDRESAATARRWSDHDRVKPAPNPKEKR